MQERNINILSERNRRLFVFLGAICLLGFAAGFLALRSLRVLPRLAFAPGWVMQDQSGSKVTSDSLRGSILLLTISCTSCEQPNQGTYEIMRETLNLLRETAPPGSTPIRLLTVSIRSEEQHARQLRLAELDATGDEWLLLSTNEDELSRILRDGFQLYYERMAEGDYRFDPVFILVDGLGIIRARHRIGYPKPETLVQKIHSLLREAEADGGSLGAAYRAAHYFSCYSST